MVAMCPTAVDAISLMRSIAYYSIHKVGSIEIMLSILSTPYSCIARPSHFIKEKNRDIGFL